jgi:type II secretory pathway pseudopilin PulG
VISSKALPLNQEQQQAIARAARARQRRQQRAQQNNAMAQIQLDAAGLQALIQQAVQQALQAVNQPPPPPPPPPPPTPVQFALVPGGALGGNQPTWDFSSGDVLKLFMSSTKGLEKKFDGAQVNLTHFLQQVQDRADLFGWQSIMNIVDTTGNCRSLTTEYGTLTQANMSAAANA